MEDFEQTAHSVIAELARYLANSRRGDEPVVGYLTPDEVAAHLEIPRWLSTGGMGGPELLSFVRAYCELSAGHHHPGYMAHQIAAPDLPGIVADLVQAVTNNISLIYELAPPGTVIDRAVYRWMADKAGWAQTGSGTLTNGGTLGNLIALLAARSRAVPDSWQAGCSQRLVVLAPTTSHYSLRKAAAVMGLGEAGLVPLAVDPLGRIDLARLPDTIRAVRERGQRPIALVANACATGTGLHDAIGEIGTLCAAEGIWLHVDGAHGASALLSPKLRRRFDGLHLADSMVWDAHKMLRASALCTGVLVRNAADLDTLFRQDASYLFHAEAVDVDMGQRTFETSKPPLGLKLFLILAWRGEAALRQYVEAQYEKAELLWELIQDRDDIECPYRPESNILCFRYAPQPARQLWIRDRLRREGRFYLSSVEIGGATYLRAALMSPATDRSTLEDLLNSITKVAAED